MKTCIKSIYLFSIIFTLMTFSLPAHAYVGPGVGLSAFGTLIALVSVILTAILGFFWFPIKRLLDKYPHKSASNIIEDDTDSVR